MPQIGLVLGAGGEVGHAFHAGVLAALSDVAGWDARDAEVVVGTSAGSIIGAMLRAGLSGPDLAARAGRMPMSEDGRRLVERAEDATRNLPPIPEQSGRGRVPTMSAPGALVRAAFPPWNAKPGAVVAAAMPEGRISTEVIARGLRALFDHWPDRALWINAVQLHTSRRVTFGRDATGAIDVATAVAASCAIPAFFAPVSIDGIRYVDGGAHSPTNADLVAGLGLDLVVVSSPMSIAGNSLRLAADEPARRLARYALGREVARIRSEGTPVLTFQPTPADVAVMGVNPMERTRRSGITRRVRASASERLRRGDAQDLWPLLTASSRPRA